MSSPPFISSSWSTGNSGLVDVKVYDPIPAALSASSSVYGTSFSIFSLAKVEGKNRNLQITGTSEYLNLFAICLSRLQHYGEEALCSLANNKCWAQIYLWQSSQKIPKKCLCSYEKQTLEVWCLLGLLSLTASIRENMHFICKQEVLLNQVLSWETQKGT